MLRRMRRIPRRRPKRRMVDTEKEERPIFY